VLTKGSFKFSQMSCWGAVPTEDCHASQTAEAASCNLAYTAFNSSAWLQV
jgi:hypothetical protein